MTPKEKAEQLVDTFKPNAYRGACEENDELMELYHSKQCALISVNEIISLMIKFHGRHIEDNSTEIEYWQEVKNEINKQDNEK